MAKPLLACNLKCGKIQIFEKWNQHLTFWREQKTYEKIWEGKLRWLTFTNRFDNHKSNWALSDKYHSDAKWFGKHNGIIHFCLNLIAAKAFISRRWRTILKSRSVLFFFIPPKCQVLVLCCWSPNGMNPKPILGLPDLETNSGSPRSDMRLLFGAAYYVTVLKSYIS